jgi:hypothetical protein
MTMVGVVVGVVAFGIGEDPSGVLVKALLVVVWVLFSRMT